jgi:methionyl-tRNA formyltransferase
MLAARVARRAFDAAHPIVRRPTFARLGAILRQRGIPHLVPPARNVNDDAFNHRVLPALRADFALSLICLQVFRAPLLAAFQRTINYHNGMLPAYRGLNATAWSVYRSEPLTGFSYHRMTEGIDEGPVLVSGAIPVSSGASVAELEWAKAQLAAASADRVLDALMRGDCGVPQNGLAAYFGRAEMRSVTTVGDPSTLSWSELLLRVRAFGRIRLQIAGAWVDVTRLRRQGVRAARPGLAFVTADGIRAEVDRIGYLPSGLGRLLRTPETD